MGNNQPKIDLNATCENFMNVNQNIIYITQDKLHVILMKHEKKNKKFYSWTTPLGIFLSCLVATLTSDFEKALLFSPDTWKAIFILCTLISGFWFVYSACNAWNNRKDREIDDLIEEIKNTESK